MQQLKSNQVSYQEKKSSLQVFRFFWILYTRLEIETVDYMSWAEKKNHKKSN